MVAGIEIQVEAPDSRDARWCLNAYFTEIAARFEGGFDAAADNTARDEDMTPPAGYFFVARLDGRPVGCGALKLYEGRVGDVKRMWTAPSARGMGVASAVLDAIEAKAAGVGIGTLRLETNKVLLEAQAMYRRRGYREVEAFNDLPYAHFWFAKQL